MRIATGILSAVLVLTSLSDTIGNPIGEHSKTQLNLCFDKWLDAIGVITQDVSKEVLSQVRTCSVSVLWEGKAVGSGVLFKRGEEMWVITCKHVVAPGDWRQAGLTVAQRRPDGRVIGIQVDAVELSPDDDVALLRACLVVFPKGATLVRAEPELDTPVVHCGSMAGQHQTLTRGYVVGVNRPHPEREGKILDQVDLSAQPGSSGGGVFLAKTGECIGLVMAVSPPSVVYVLPTRRIVGKEQ